MYFVLISNSVQKSRHNSFILSWVDSANPYYNPVVHFNPVVKFCSSPRFRLAPSPELDQVCGTVCALWLPHQSVAWEKYPIVSQAIQRTPKSIHLHINVSLPHSAASQAEWLTYHLHSVYVSGWKCLKNKTKQNQNLLSFMLVLS